MVLINFDPATYQEFKVGVPREGDYVEILNTDAVELGGSGVLNTGTVSSRPESWNGRDDSITIKVPPLAGVVFKRVGPSSYVPPKPPRAKRIPRVNKARKEKLARDLIGEVVPTGKTERARRRIKRNGRG